MCSLLSASLYAQQEQEPIEGQTITLAPIVVTAEQILEYVRNHPQSVVVLRRKEIEDRNFLEVGEAIGSMPGVEVRQRSGTMGARIIIRGGGGSGPVSILVDGRPINSSQYGGVDLNSIPIEIVKEIIAFKPPVPVWLGPGSSAGAVNIITRGSSQNSTKKGKNKGRLKISGGSYGAANISSTYIIPQDEGQIMLAAGASHRDGKRSNSDRDSGNFSFNWGKKGKSQIEYDLNGRYYHAYHGSPGPTDNPTPNARQRYRKGSFDLRVNGLMGNAGEFSLKSYADMEDLKDKSQTGDTSSLDEYKIGVSGETVWFREDAWALRVGGLTEKSEVEHDIAGDHQREKISLHMQYDREIEDLTMSLGLRGDYTNDFEAFPALFAGLSYALRSNTILKANAGYSINIPSFNQLYQPSHGSIDQVRGNPDLTEEKIYSYDLSLANTFNPDVIIELTAFRTDTQGLITYIRGADLIYRPENMSRAYRQGLEVSLTSRWSKAISVELSYIYQKAENRKTDDELAYSPRHNAKVTGKFFLPTRTKVEAIIKAVSHRYSNPEGETPIRLDSYCVADAKIIHPILMGTLPCEIFVHFHNLFDSDFEFHAGYPDDGLRFVAGINMNF